MASPNSSVSEERGTLFVKLLIATLIAIMLVVGGTIIHLSKGSSDHTFDVLNFPIEEFKFAFGSGIPVSDHMRVDQFANGYALLSSGPVSLSARQLRVLNYRWQPSKMPHEAAFFWRRSGALQNVLRMEITVAGSHQVDLFAEPGWRGEIVEFGFLVAGDTDEVVEVGDVTFIPDNLDTRLQIAWTAWTTFEHWSQQSINFLRGGGKGQIIALPVIITAWLLITISLFLLFSRLGKTIASRQLLTTTGTLFLIAWLLLDIRWSANNLHQIKQSFQTLWSADDEQRAMIDLDAEIYQYIKRLKSDILDEKAARILIIGDETSIDYYLLRAKYHLLPNSANVSGGLAKNLATESLNFVIFFGEPNGITGVPGWNPYWQKNLQQIDTSKWGAIYRSR